MSLWLVAGCLAVGAWQASAQVMSPGLLTRQHADLEGLDNCAQCHTKGMKFSNALCTECHKEIGTRQEADRGYHARVKSHPCFDCHKEHRGREYQIVQWSPPQRAFPHNLTDWPLTGAHKKQQCKDCHDNSRVVEPDITKLVNDAPTRETFLGLKTDCINCHFDEHRAQASRSCEECHTTDEFKKVPIFDHDETKFRLTGKHEEVACVGCHETLIDPHRHPPWPKPRSDEYLRLVDIPFASCDDCHDDVHDGKLGPRCDSCHVTDSFSSIRQDLTDASFHGKTRFPLKGLHADVSCRLCHGPHPGKKARFKNLAFQTCGDCHIDAHAGQLEDVTKCDRCHNESGFSPSLFSRKAHQETRYPLEMSHEVVACSACHTPDPKLKEQVPLKVRQRLAREKRRLLVSDIKIDFDGDLDRCDICHQDVHENQFAERVKAKGCADCHKLSSFRELSFDHEESRFPITGKHKDTACGSCHLPQKKVTKEKTTTWVLYRPMERACVGCHLDIHVGQLAIASKTDCLRCHQTEGFDKTLFDHNDPKLSSFPLLGKHHDVECSKCHPTVDVGLLQTVRYKPVPTACAGCHVDEHEGRFDGFEPPSQRPTAKKGAP